MYSLAQSPDGGALISTLAGSHLLLGLGLLWTCSGACAAAKGFLIICFLIWKVLWGIGVYIYGFELKCYSRLKSILWLVLVLVGILIFELSEAWLMFQGKNFLFSLAQSPDGGALISTLAGSHLLLRLGFGCFNMVPFLLIILLGQSVW